MEAIIDDPTYHCVYSTPGRYLLVWRAGATTYVDHLVRIGNTHWELRSPLIAVQEHNYIESARRNGKRIRGGCTCGRCATG